MDWSSLGPVFLKLGLPALKIAITAGAGAIPVVGAFIGPAVADAVGAMLSQTFGVPAEPAAVKAAIENTSTTEALAKLQAVQAEVVARWPAVARVAEAEEATARTQIDATTTQMKQEILAASTIREDSNWRTVVLVMNSIWRPLFAMEWLIECMCWSFFIMVTLARSDAFDIDSLIKLEHIVLLYVGARFGLVGWHMKLRKDEKESVIEAVSDTPPPVSMNDIKNMLRGQGVRTTK